MRHHRPAAAIRSLPRRASHGSRPRRMSYRSEAAVPPITGGCLAAFYGSHPVLRPPQEHQPPVAGGAPAAPLVSCHQLPPGSPSLCCRVRRNLLPYKPPSPASHFRNSHLFPDHHYFCIFGADSDRISFSLPSRLDSPRRFCRPR